MDSANLNDQTDQSINDIPVNREPFRTLLSPIVKIGEASSDGDEEHREVSADAQDGVRGWPNHSMIYRDDDEFEGAN